MMGEIFIGALEEGYRDALLAYSLGQVCRKSTQLSPLKLMSADDLYHYLLIDPLVKQGQQTTEVASAISSLQQLTHAIYNHGEPGYSSGEFSEDTLERWNNIESKLSLWSANQLLMHYAENYIDPDLRLNKTTLFSDFLNSVAQTRISTDSVQQGVLNYLAAMEKLCGIHTVSGFIWHHSSQTDSALTDGKLVFLGQTGIPGREKNLWWRSVSQMMSDVDGKLRLSPAGWQEWQEITLAEEAVASRILWFDNHPLLVYLTREDRREHNELTQTDGSQNSLPGEESPSASVQLYTLFTLKMMVCFTDGSWSSPVTLDKSGNIPAESTLDEYQIELATEVVTADSNDQNIHLVWRVAPAEQPLRAQAELPETVWRAVVVGKNLRATIWKMDAAGLPDALYQRLLQLFERYGQQNVHGNSQAQESVQGDVTIVSENNGQFLALGSLATRAGCSHVRLNTRLAGQLVDTVSHSVASLFSWSIQQLEEVPPPEGAQNVPLTLDFNGANGRYFWELFFHIPHAVARRLQDEMNFSEAQTWYHYIFNPQARQHADADNGTPWWGIRPLAQPMDAVPAWELQMGAVADPDAICYSNPLRYRKAIFMDYVRNILSQGDMLYRQLTRDTLTEARLHYARVAALLGPAPDSQVANFWQPASLAQIAAENRTGQELEPLMVWLPEALPQITLNTLSHWQALNYPTRFRQPVNPDLVALWQWLAQRLATLRNNLTLDGKPMSLDMYQAALDPRDLLRAQAGGGGLAQVSATQRVTAPPYRFNALLPRARAAAETLTRFGEQLHWLRFQHDRQHFEMLQLAHLEELSGFALKLQEMALEQARAQISILEATREIHMQRRDHFKGLLDEGISSSEQKNLNMLSASAVLHGIAGPMYTASGLLHMAPNIFGFVVGGQKWGAVARSFNMLLRMEATTLQIVSDRLQQSEFFRRRNQEWKQGEDQASAELEVMDKQLSEAQLALQAVQLQLLQTRVNQQHMRDQYQYLLKRNSNHELYQWLINKQASFYYQAYDSVVSLMLATEASWQFETGEYHTRYIQPAVWFDRYAGLTAGEALSLQLLKMEHGHLQRHERRLEIVKTCSLLQSADWQQVINEILTHGYIDIHFDAASFDSDYPGHYLRQIHSIDVAFPGAVGPWEELKATLTQITSHTLLKENIQAAQWLYEKNGVTPAVIISGARSGQTIALSGQSNSETGENGQHVRRTEYDDERYLAFEGTGAISSWRLQFPRFEQPEKQAQLARLQDIVVTLRYSAKEGNRVFTEEVASLVSQRLSSLS